MELNEDYLKKFHIDPAANKHRAGQPQNEWQEQLDNFAARLNPDRKKAGYKPYSLPRIAKLLNNAGVHDAAAAYRTYRHIDTAARNFGQLFEHITRPKK